MKIPGPNWQEAHTLNFSAPSSRKTGEGRIDVVLVTNRLKEEQSAKAVMAEELTAVHRREQAQVEDFWVPPSFVRPRASTVPLYGGAGPASDAEKSENGPPEVRVHLARED